ncbi:LON peptidase substrate-binding domain-containing protein [Luminiphilus sp. nBUS_07]|uniref:LON peptidase substrate-binding domain-containing protein n=1 Tax=Luminiphilus sp. nBUS_07 TaxID=3395314 RepID=UPI003EB8879F
MTEIPLFPLSSALVPYGYMPLQIFEQRYLDMVAACMRTGTGFGVVWLRQGSEVSGGSQTTPDVGDYGTHARITDFDQLPNGLLGITIRGEERFDIAEVWRDPSGLIRSRVSMEGPLEPAPMTDEWRSLEVVLRGLESHPHIQRMNLTIDYNNAWEVAFNLIQLLPFDESIKYELLGMATLNELIVELDILLNQISGEEG